jgi:hypothetical protein
MSTRAQIRFATREEGVTFSEHPSAIHAQFYVHHDGYPEFLGVEIAKSILDSTTIDNLEIEYLDTERSDLEYIYYVWQAPSKTTWISIFKLDWKDDEREEVGFPWKSTEKCIFVGEPQKLLEKYD